jgi:hypothetical protein
MGLGRVEDKKKIYKKYKILVNKKYIISYIKNGNTNTKRKENCRESYRENNKTSIKLSGKL